MQNLTFCVYNIVQNEFQENPIKFQKSQESVFFCKCDYYFLLHLLSFFPSHQKFQTKNYLAIFKNLLFWFIIPCENVTTNFLGCNHQMQFICVVTASYRGISYDKKFLVSVSVETQNFETKFFFKFLLWKKC